MRIAINIWEPVKTSNTRKGHRDGCIRSYIHIADRYIYTLNHAYVRKCMQVMYERMSLYVY